MANDVPPDSASSGGEAERSHDRVFDDAWRPEDFRFDEQVARVFDDMVARSVPFYTEIQRMQAELVVSLLGDGPRLVYDLGCSTATTIDAIAKHPDCPPETRFVGLDNSAQMLDQARTKLAADGLGERVDLVEGDIDGDFEIRPCDAVLMNWTLQFVRPIYRESLIKRVAESLNPGGALLLSEKILLTDSMMNRLYIRFYYDYKRRQGYTDTEIRNKREALENVLVPYRSEENHDLLKRNGFTTVDSYFRWFNFECLVAIKH